MNTFLWDLNNGFQGDKIEPPAEMLRLPIPGEPDVPDLVHPGDFIKTSYDTGGIVVGIYPRIFHGITIYHIAFVNRMDAAENSLKKHNFSGINDVVARGGKLCHLFKDNKDTFKIVPIPPEWIIGTGVRKYLERQAQPVQIKLF